MKNNLITKLFALLVVAGMSITTAMAQPANDAACSATSIAIGATVTGDNTGATPDGPLGSCFSDADVSNDIWFSFVAPAGGVINVTTTDIGGGNSDTQVAVYSGSCAGTLTEVGCSEDIDGTNFMSFADVCDLTPGETYLIQVDSWQDVPGTGDIGSFDITVTSTTCPLPCDPSSCEAGSLDDDSDVTACPDDLVNLAVTGMVIPPAATCDASGAVIFTPNAGGTGGIEGRLTLFGVTFPYDLDSDLNGVLSANGLPPLRGSWSCRPSVFLNGVSPTLSCDSTGRDRDVTFLEFGDPGCGANECVAGTVVAGNQTVCPGDATDLTLSADHDLISPGDFYWFFDNYGADTTSYVYNFGSDPTFYQVNEDLNAFLAGFGLPELFPGDWEIQGAVVDLADTTICDVTDIIILTVLDAADPACGGDCSVYDTAPTDLTKSFDPVGGVQDRVQVKFYKATPQVRYTDADAAMCDIKFWPFKTLDPETGDVTGDATGDTLYHIDKVKTYGDGSPREIFKWPVKFRADGANNTSRAEPNLRYRWQVRCECGHDGTGPESPWSDVKIFNVPDFDPVTGIYTPPVGIAFDLGDDDNESAVRTSDVHAVDQKVAAMLVRANTSQGKLYLPRKGQSVAKRIASVKSDISNIYPNPAEDVLNIELQVESDNAVISIIDMMGRTISIDQMKSNNGSLVRFDLSGLTSGMYMVEVNVDGKLSHKPFMVK